MLAQVISNALSQEKLTLFISLRSALQKIINDFEFKIHDTNKPDAHLCINNPIVIPFGSITCATAFDDGDVDFALLFNRRRKQFSNETQFGNLSSDLSRAEQEEVLLSLHRYIKNKWGNIMNIVHDECIFKARTPILSYASLYKEESEVKGENVKFDISLSLNGIRNSFLLRKYMLSDQRLRQGTMYLKQWGRRKCILNARRGFISPYALTIMYIYFMQLTGQTRCEYDEEMVKEEVDNMLRSILQNREIVNEHNLFNEVVPLSHVNHELIESDLKSFFNFFSSSGCFDFDTAVVDIRSHGTIKQKDEWFQLLADIDAKERWHLLGHEMLMLRDPFEEHNLGRSVDFFNAENIREEFRLAAKNITREQILH